MPSPNRGAVLFAAYLVEHSLSQSQAGKLFGVAKSYVGLLANARATPGLGLAALIEEKTSGTIPCRSWKEPVIP
jgi:hypothetical protein